MQILVIDDDEVARDILGSVLPRFGFPVSCAPDGTTALEMLQKENFPVVVCDWEMPGVSGLDVCRWIRSQRRRCYVIILTARTGFGDTLEGLDSGADCFLSKPCDPRMLLDHIRVGQRILEEAAQRAPVPAGRAAGSGVV